MILQLHKTSYVRNVAFLTHALLNQLSAEFTCGLIVTCCCVTQIFIALDVSLSARKVTWTVACLPVLLHLLTRVEMA